MKTHLHGKEKKTECDVYIYHLVLTNISHIMFAVVLNN